MTCSKCDEWFEVWTNTGSVGLCYCPCCGHEFSNAELEKMNEEDEGAEEVEG